MSESDVVTVNEIDPDRLVFGGSKFLEPYLGRDVDPVLDRALAQPGFVVVSYEDGSGARRTAYEALRRNLGDAQLLVNTTERQFGGAHGTPSTVVWLDGNQITDRDFEARIGGLAQWCDLGPRRWGLVLLRTSAVERLPATAQRIATMIRIPAALSERERAAVRQRYPDSPPVHTIEELASLSLAALRFEGKIAGYQADTDDGADQLDIGADVRMMADLVTSRLITPPLSIGLFGNWGSGKSFFMRQMRERVRILADAAAEAETNSGQRGTDVSSYCSSVRQITFNAWHYAEANLWASLATHIFDSLARPPETEQSLLDQLSELETKRALLVSRSGTARTGAVHRLRGILLALVRSADLPEDARRLVEEADGLRADSRGLWRELRRDPLPYGVGMAIVVAGALIRPDWAWVSAIVGAAGVAVTAIARLRATIRHIRAAAEAVDETTAQIAELDREVAEVRQRIKDLPPLRDLSAFAGSRVDSQDYRRHLGVVSVLRRDLNAFATIMARRQAMPGVDVERIVLYIDDLDRCPPKVVIQVLEAVHLLLAMPVFVVVVGVDARWLTRAIRQHYAVMLDDEADDGLAVNYLEKIFQIPFALSRMTPRGFTKLVGGLAAGESTSATVQPAPARPTGELAESPDPTPPTTPATGPEPASPQMDLRPSRLTISAEELEFIGTLSPLVSSPREAKRLVNLYQLVRARFVAEHLDDFLTGDADAPYRAVLVLLTVMVGRTEWASSPTDAITAAIAQLDHTSVPSEMASYRRWVPLVERFSFGYASVGASPADA